MRRCDAAATAATRAVATNLNVAVYGAPPTRDSATRSGAEAAMSTKTSPATTSTETRNSRLDVIRRAVRVPPKPATAALTVRRHVSAKIAKTAYAAEHNADPVFRPIFDLLGDRLSYSSFCLAAVSTWKH